MAQKLFETNLTHGPYDNIAEAAMYAATCMDQIRLRRDNKDVVKEAQSKLTIVIGFLENYPKSDKNSSRGLVYGCAVLEEFEGRTWSKKFGREPKFSQRVGRLTKEMLGQLNSSRTALEFGQPLEPGEAAHTRDLLLILRKIASGIDRQRSGPRY